MQENLTILTMKELKEDIKNNLEYSDPHDSFSYGSNKKLSPGMKPVVGDVFFETEDEAVAYTLKTDELYALVKDCADDVQVIENYGDDGALLPYQIYRNNKTN